MLYKRILPFVIALLVIPTLINAQITTSSMTGTVKSIDGEDLIGATISATHQPTGTNYTTVSRAGGSFSIPNMRSGGPYTVIITYVGYKTDSYDNINLLLGEPYILNSVLQKSNATLEGVTVTATGRNAILNANRTGASTNVGITQIQRMPSISRNLNDLLKISPQANGNSVGGGNFRQNYITVDGSDFNNTFGIGNNLPAGGSPISLDALAEISINITPFDIRQSGFIGSAVNAVTRSGTNNVSGTAYYYWRSEKQQGDKVNKTTFVRNPFQFKQYGASIGFPLIPNKLFVFVNYETENQPKQVSTRFASTASNPYTGSGSIARPTADSLTYISNYLRDKYGYETGPFDNYSTAITREKFLARIDWNINSHNRFNIRYNQVEGGEPNPPSTSRSPMTGFANGAGRNDINTLWYQNSNYFQGANFYSLAAELNSSYGKIANTLRGTYTFQNDSRQTTSSFFPFVDILSYGTPYTSFGYEPFSYGNLRKVKTFSVVDNVTLTLNKNQITFGGQLDHSTTINGFQRFASSYYTFASWNDFATGQKPLDFGITYSLSPGYAQAFPSFKFAQLSLYAQDEISVSNKFRLTLGVRADRPTYPGVAEIKTHPLVAALTFANGEKINTGALPSAKVLWSPRLGFNWDVYGDRSLQVRGGTGIFTGRVPFVWIVSQSGDAGLLQITSTTETPTAQRNGSPANFTTPGPFNPNPAAYLPATQPPSGTIIPSTISALAPNFKFPSAWKTSLAFDKKIGAGLIFTLEGIINKDINPTVFRNPNLVAPSPLNITGYPDNRLFYPNAVKDKFVNPLTAATFNATTNPNPSTAVPNGDARGTQAFNSIVMDNGKGGYYASLTAKLEKQFTKGFYGSIAYVGSIADNKFDGGGDQPLSAWQGTATINGANYPELGNASYIVPTRIIASLSYRKEYLRNLGTTISLTYEGSSEGRFSYTYSADFNRDGTNNDLIYIPKDPSEITFVSKTVGTGASAVTFTPQQQSDMFFAYIDQDSYLRKHKGEYAQRNAVNRPWRNEVNVKLLQDVFVNVGKKRNTVQFSLDIFNIGNLLNPAWGIFHTINASSILVPTNVTSLVTGGTVKPTFQLATVGNGLATSTYRENVSIASTYFMQFGLRYIFN